MKILIDNADVGVIKQIWAIYPCSGVTTNPSILAAVTKEGENPFDLLQAIRELIGDDMELHIQALAKDCDAIVEEAQHIASKLSGNLYVKIPADREGLKAIKEVEALGIKTTATGIYSAGQAILAAKAGASYLAPYINRMENLGKNAIDEVDTIQQVLDLYGYDSKIIAASFKNTSQVLNVALLGIESVTVAPDVLESFMNDKNVENALDTFRTDFEKAYGNGKTMLDY